MFNKIVFFHNHVNGDCFLSRIIVKQIIEATNLDNINYYYTAPEVTLYTCPEVLGCIIIIKNAFAMSLTSETTLSVSKLPIRNFFSCFPKTIRAI